jgi:hypothetical protein
VHADIGKDKGFVKEEGICINGRARLRMQMQMQMQIQTLAKARKGTENRYTDTDMHASYSHILFTWY